MRKEDEEMEAQDGNNENVGGDVSRRHEQTT